MILWGGGVLVAVKAKSGDRDVLRRPLFIILVIRSQEIYVPFRKKFFGFFLIYGLKPKKKRRDVRNWDTFHFRLKLPLSDQTRPSLIHDKVMNFLCFMMEHLLTCAANLTY